MKDEVREKITEYKKKLTEAKTKINQMEGERKTILKSLKDEFNISSLPEAKKELVEVKKLRDKLYKELNDLMKEIEAYGF
jgi:uncharacterized coiled-coil DUF342 family protein